jgi:hypothetical protein
LRVPDCPVGPDYIMKLSGNSVFADLERATRLSHPGMGQLLFRSGQSGSIHPRIECPLPHIALPSLPDGCSLQTHVSMVAKVPLLVLSTGIQETQGVRMKQQPAAAVVFRADPGRRYFGGGRRRRLAVDRAPRHGFAPPPHADNPSGGPHPAARLPWSRWLQRAGSRPSD